jgi:voltage-gated potassium channel Kch
MALPLGASGSDLSPESSGSRTSGLIWLLTLAAGAAALTFAATAWLAQGRPGDWTGWLDFGVRTLKVLLLSDIYYDVEARPGSEWLFVVARSAGVVFSVLVALRIALLAAKSRLAVWWLGFRSRHDVVLGGTQAADEYITLMGRREVTHVTGEESKGGRVARQRRAGPLEKQLDRAKAGRARRVIVSESTDAETWNTAQTAARVCSKTPVLAFIKDSWIQDQLTRDSLDASLWTFSYAGGAARQVMLAHPPYLLARRYGFPAQHIVIVGFGAVGQALAREFLVTSVSNSPAKMMITAVDEDMDTLRKDFEARHPGIEGVVDIDYIKGDIRADGQDLVTKLTQRIGASGACAVYVALKDTDVSLSVATALPSRAIRLSLLRCPIFVCAHHGAGRPAVRQGAGNVGRTTSQGPVSPGNLLEDLKIVSFGAWRDAFDGAGLFEPELDQQAKAFHNAYLRNFAAKPGDADNPAAQQWSQLRDDFRIANRRAAAHARAKLDAAGFDLDAWLTGRTGGWNTHDLPPASDVFRLDDPAQLDVLADLEHRRWVLDRVLNGWRHGPTRDNLAKVHPDILPTNQLPEGSIDKDRSNIRVTAGILQEIVKSAKSK